jgi:hypothetical protein
MLEFWNLLMETVETVLYKLSEFFSWLYSTLGLEQWQVLLIALAVILVLSLIARVQRKKMVKKVHTIPAGNRSEIIGIKLSGHKSRDRGAGEIQKHSLTLTSEMDEKQMGWAQTTKEWRNLTEQVRQLRHEITKHKRTEEHLKNQLNELTMTNQELQDQITEHKKAEKTPTPNVIEAATSEQQIPHETTDSQSTEESLQPHMMQTPVDEQIQQEINQPVQTDQSIKQEIAEPLVMMNEQPQSDVSEEEKVEKETELKVDDVTADTEQSEPEITNHHRQEQLLKEEIEEPEDSKQHEAPLDVQELKAISELAKRLRGNNRQ